MHKRLHTHILSVGIFIFISLSAAHESCANYGDIAIWREATATDAITTANFDHNWDTTVIEDATSFTMQAGNTNIALDLSGHYLVLYSARWDSTGGAGSRSEIQTQLRLAGADVPIGWAQCYLRRQNGADECIVSGGGIINATAADQLSLRSFRTDNTAATAQRRASYAGIMLVKLDDNWDYVRLRHNTSQPGSVTASFRDVVYNTQDELDTDSFAHTVGQATVTLKTKGHYLVFANTYGAITAGSTDRTNIIQRITLDGTEVDGSRTTLYLRGSESCNEGAASIGMMIETTTVNMALNIEAARDDGTVAWTINRMAGGATIVDRTALTIAKLPDDAHYVRFGDTGTDDLNVNNFKQVTWDTQTEIDTPSFTHTAGQGTITVDVTDDYLFFTVNYTENTAVTQAYFDQGWEVNNGAVTTYAHAGAYVRNSGANDAGNWSGIVFSALAAGSGIEVVSASIAVAGVVPNEYQSVQGVRFDTLFGRYYWTGATDNDWNDETNWDGPAGYPDDSQDIAVIDTTDDVISNLGATITIGGLEVQPTFTGMLDIDRRFSVAGSATFAGTFILSASATVRALGRQMGVTGGGDILISAGQLITNSTISIANAPGVMTVSGGTVEFAHTNTGAISIGAGTITNSGGTILYSGPSATTTIQGEFSPYYNLEINGTSSTFSLDEDITVNNDLSMTAQTFDVNDLELTINGDMFLSSGSIMTGVATVTFGNAAGDSVVISGGILRIESNATPNDIVINAGTWTNSGGTVAYRKAVTGTTSLLSSISPYYNLFVNASGTYSFNGAVTVNNDYTQAGGTVDTDTTNNYDLDVTDDFTQTAGTFNARDSLITVGGDFVVSITDGFTEGTSTIRLTGTGNLRNDSFVGTSFRDLDVAATGKTTTLTGNISLASNGLLTVGDGTITQSGSRSISLTGKTGGPITRSTNSDMSFSTLIYLAGGSEDVSGIDYDQITTIQLQIGATHVLVGDVIAQNMQLAGGSLISGDAILTTTATTNYSITLSGDLTLGGIASQSGEIRVNASTITIGDDVVFDNASGDDSFYGGSANITVGGDWNNANGGTMVMGSSTVTFIMVSNSTVTSGGGAFYDVVVDNNETVPTLRVGDAMDINGDLTITSGELTNTGAHTINIAGNWSNADIFTSGLSTVFFDGNTTQTINAGASLGTGGDDSSKDFNNLTIQGTTELILVGSELEVDGTLTVNTTAVLDLSGQTLDLNGTLSNNGIVELKGSETVQIVTMDTDSGRFRYYGDGAAATTTHTVKDFGATDYYHLEIDDTASSNEDTFVLGADLTVNGTLFVDDGILTTSTTSYNVTTYNYTGTGGLFMANASTITCGNDWLASANDVFSPGTSLVDLTSTASYFVACLTANKATPCFYDVNIAQSGGTANTALAMTVGNVMNVGSGTITPFLTDVIRFTKTDGVPLTVAAGADMSHLGFMYTCGARFVAAVDYDNVAGVGFWPCATTYELQGDVTLSGGGVLVVGYDTTGAVPARLDTTTNDYDIDAGYLWVGDALIADASGVLVLNDSTVTFSQDVVFGLLGSSNTLNAGTSLIEVRGSWDNTNGGVMNMGTSEVQFDDTSGTSAITSSGESFAFLTVDDGGANALTVRLNDALDLSASLTINSGTLSAGVGSYTINIAGDWYRNGGKFLPQSGSVFFDGGDQAITGSNTFYNLYKIDTVNDGSGPQMAFPASRTQVVQNDLYLSGFDSDDLVSIVSDTPGTRSRISVSSHQQVYYLDVSDQAALGSDIVAAFSLDTTNNDSGEGSPQWEFGELFNISGTTDVNGVTVKTAIDGTLASENTVTAAGAWTIRNVTLNDNDIITVWLDAVAEANESTGITENDGIGANTISGMELFANVLTIGSDEDEAITLTEAGLYDGNNDEDIGFLANIDIFWMDVGGTYTDEFLKIQTGDTFTLGATERMWIHNLNNDGTLTALGSSTIRVNGSWDNTAGTFAANTSSVLLYSTSASESISTGGDAFYDLYVNDGMYVYYRFEESSSPSIDDSGYKQNGTWQGSASATADTIPTLNFANAQSAIFLEADQSYIEVQDEDGATISGLSTTATFAFWINTTQTGNDNIYDAPGVAGVDDSGSGDEIFWGWIDGSGYINFQKGLGANVSSAAFGSVVNDGAWHHIAITWDSSTGDANLYFDGNLADSQTTDSGDVSAKFTGIGRIEENGGGGAVYFDGYLDDVRIYDRILTPTEIGRLAAGDTPATGVTEYTMEDDLDINNDLFLNSGTIFSKTSDITLAGDWNNFGGVFLEGSNSVTFDGTLQSIPASETFYKMSKQMVSSTTLTVGQRSTLTITNTATLQGASGELLSLRSSTTGTRFYIDPQSTRNISFVDVKDSENLTAPVINPPNSVNSGNTQLWFIKKGSVMITRRLTIFDEEFLVVMK